LVGGWPASVVVSVITVGTLRRLDILGPHHARTFAVTTVFV